jgi:regulator of protease activity HflC (stomatin/prohibitin superfamily)
VAQANAAREKYPAKSPQLLAEQKRINAASQTQLKQVLGPVKYKELLSKQRQMAAQMQQRTR